MDKRLFPVTPEFFTENIEPIINKSYIWKGRPPLISHYKVFCAILYVLRTGVAWRDLPSVYGNWHSIYTRFSRGNEKSLWWKILMILPHRKNVAIVLLPLPGTNLPDSPILRSANFSP